MSENMKRFLKDFSIILFQTLGVLVLVFVGLWLFGAFFLFGALSRL